MVRQSCRVIKLMTRHAQCYNINKKDKYSIIIMR